MLLTCVAFDFDIHVITKCNQVQALPHLTCHSSGDGNTFVAYLSFVAVVDTGSVSCFQHDCCVAVT